MTQGRMASTNRADEIMMAPVVAKLLGFHVGQTIPFGFYSNAAAEPARLRHPAVQAGPARQHALVGLAEFNSEIVEDDVDTFPTFIPLTPAFTREVFALKGQQFGRVDLRDPDGPGHQPRCPPVEREIGTAGPPGEISTYHALAPVMAKADRSLQPISIALGVFGAVTLLAALLIAAQLIARRFRTETADLAGAAGAGRQSRRHHARRSHRVGGVRSSSGRSWPAASPSPCHPWHRSARCARSTRPAGLAFDWTVLGFGMLILLVLLTAIAVALGRTRRRRTASRCGRGIRSTARGARVVASAGAGRTAGARRGRGPHGARAGRGPQLGPGALGAARVDARRRARRDDAHLRQQPADPRLEPPAVRVELDVHPQPGRGRGWQRPAGRLHAAAATTRTSRPTAAPRTTTWRSTARGCRSSSRTSVPP